MTQQKIQVKLLVTYSVKPILARGTSRNVSFYLTDLTVENLVVEYETEHFRREITKEDYKKIIEKIETNHFTARNERIHLDMNPDCVIFHFMQKII